MPRPRFDTPLGERPARAIRNARTDRCRTSRTAHRRARSLALPCPRRSPRRRPRCTHSPRPPRLACSPRCLPRHTRTTGRQPRGTGSLPRRHTTSRRCRRRAGRASSRAFESSKWIACLRSRSSTSARARAQPPRSIPDGTARDWTSRSGQTRCEHSGRSCGRRDAVTVPSQHMGSRRRLRRPSGYSTCRRGGRHRGHCEHIQLVRWA